MARGQGSADADTQSSPAPAARNTESVASLPPDPQHWWPRLTAPQVQALLGAGITLALVLWDQVRQRLLK